eukprot:1013000-Prymnesium_polylepis.1
MPAGAVDTAVYSRVGAVYGFTVYTVNATHRYNLLCPGCRGCRSAVGPERTRQSSPLRGGPTPRDWRRHSHYH